MRIYEDLRVAQHRLGVFQSLVVGLFALLLIYFWNLQVVRGRYFRTLADNNRTRAVTLAAPRGALLDRHGRVLVENRPSFNVVLTPEHSENLDRAVARLSRTLSLGEAAIRERLARRASPFHAVVVKTDASLEDVQALEARRMELPEVSIDVVPLRSYPLASAAAHALGRVGEITERQLESKDFEGIDSGALVGQAGLESQYNRRLMGKDGSRRVVVNSRGVEMGEAAREAPVDGPSATLTLDADLQTAAEKAFAGRAGSAVALDPATGEILAMTSVPAYDPNRFTTGVDPALWGQLSTDPSTPLMNRVIQGQYPPGSVFKIVMATAGLEEGVISPTTSFLCPGQLAVYNTVFRCGRAGGHGYVSVHQALAQSCNVFFYQLGIRLGIGRIAAWSKRMGLGAPTGVDLPHELPGLIPSPEWKLRTQRVPWYGGETVSVAIGQGQVTVTPLQLARLVAIVANGGHLVRPHLLRSLGGVALPEDPPPDLGLKPETIAVVRAGLQAVVDEGSGIRARFKEIKVGGKTGSAQVVSKARLEKSRFATAVMPHGWFVAFAPVEAPRIALAVLVEHAGSGGAGAAPLAREIIARYFGLSSTPSAPSAPSAPASVDPGGAEDDEVPDP